MAMSPVKRAFLILGCAAVVVALGLLIAQDQVTLRVRGAIAAGDPRHADYIAGLVAGDLSRGNSFDVLTNGDQIFPAMLEAIESAKRRISFETYIFDTGELAEKFTAALERAAWRGVEVRLVVDAIGASTMEQKHLNRLRAASCHVAEFNAPTWYSLEEVNYRTHRKILVVDGEVGFTGGAGMADHWMGNADRQGSLARYARADSRADRPAARGRFLRELPRSRRRRGAGARPAGAADGRNRRGPAWFAARRPAAATI